MTAAVRVQAPLALEGVAFWDTLVAECDRQIGATNRVISAYGLPPDQLLEFTHQREVQIRKPAPPSASTQLSIDFFSWGPVIRGKTNGREKDSEFSLGQWDMPIAKDLDGTVVAIFDEGRSFSPKDLARYLIQGFRRYYPAVSLPYEC